MTTNEMRESRAKHKALNEHVELLTSGLIEEYNSDPDTVNAIFNWIGGINYNGAEQRNHHVYISTFDAWGTKSYTIDVAPYGTRLETPQGDISMSMPLPSELQRELFEMAVTLANC